MRVITIFTPSAFDRMCCCRSTCSQRACRQRRVRERACDANQTQHPWIETSARATTVHRVYSRSVGPRADSPPQRGESGWNRGTVRLRHRVRGNSRVKKCVSMDAGKRQPRRKPHLLRRHRFPVSTQTALHNNHRFRSAGGRLDSVGPSARGEV